jgi:hypothetical protein
MGKSKSIAWRTMTAAAVVAGIPMATTSLAGAAPAKVRPVAEVGHLDPHVTIDRANPDVAYVKAKYRCTSDRPAHLWVSVKQGGPALDTEGSSATARSWYDSHPGEDPETDGPVCNGKWQTDTFAVQRHGAMVAGENGWYDHDAWEQLEKGKAYVQFCLYVGEDDGASLNRFLDVKFHGKANSQLPG